MPHADRFDHRGRPTVHRRRALVVDDDDAMRTFVERVLVQAGYEVATARDGDDALQLVNAEAPFDVFVLDIVMPQLMGDELGRRLRRRDPDVRVLYITGYSDRLFADRGVLWEHEAFLEKPFTERGLMEAVCLLLLGTTRSAT